MINATKMRIATSLLATVSGLTLSNAVLAGELLFSSAGVNEIETGERVTQTQGLTQVRLPNGATISILDRADYRINEEGSVDLYGGSVTVAGGDGTTIVRMPEGVEGQVTGRRAAASFSVSDDGEGRGHVLTGSARIGRAGNLREFDAGEMFAFTSGERVHQVVSNGAQSTPQAGSSSASNAPLVADLGEGGPVAAASNGLPVTLGDALAATGASSDIVAAARRVDQGLANPAVETFPSGDLGLLVASAAGLESAYGGTPFTGAQADIIRTYLGYLADGNSGASFLSAYAGILAQYLDLVRSGAAPSSFDLASLDEVNSFIAYTGRIGGLSNLASQDRVLVEAYLAFLIEGGNPDLFASGFTDLTQAYFAFVRGGGDPADFAEGSEATIAAYIAFLADSGLVQQLAEADRALVEAYLQNGGIAFAEQYRAALSSYFAFLASGRLPSEYAALDQATLVAYLEVLSDTGLLEGVTGSQAQFYADYLAYLRAGGNLDGFAGLPANVFAGYASQLDAYFAFLAAGNLPSDFSGADIALLQDYVAQLQAAGALDRFLGQNAGFFADFNAFVAAGGSADAFDQLNANIFAGYATTLSAYFAFLDAGGLPSDYSAAEIAVLNSYLAQLAAVGALDRFLGDEAAFFSDYLAFLQGGGQVDSYAGLNANIFAGYAQALAAYYDYLLNGGVPSAYATLTQQAITDYLAALEAAGATTGYLAELADFYADYFAFVVGGGNPDNFAGLPVPPDFPAFADALNAYAVFLAGGGLPNDYTAEELAVLQSYLDAIISSDQLASLLGANADLLTGYFAFLAAGGDPDGFAGLPIYADYVSALNAYYAFLASGGLPGDYTALDQATLEAYLAALNAAGGFVAFANLEAFFAEYYAFVAAGGSASDYFGLPIYLDYVAALNEYYAFLADGGLPSDYAALDQATIEAYLAALSGVTGGLSTFAALNSFFADYYVFIIGGGEPDQFADLPVNGGGGTPDVGTYPYQGGFTPAGSGILAVGSWADEGRDPLDDAYIRTLTITGPTVYDAVLDADGGLERYEFARTGYVYATRGTAQVTDINGDADLLIGRWTDGIYQRANGRGDMFDSTLTANQGFHYLLANGFTGPASYPEGRIYYDLLGATSPTLVDGSQAPGTFDASAAIIFGANPAIAMEGALTFDDFVFAFSTTGGVDGDGTPIYLPQTGTSTLGYFNFGVPGSRGDDYQGTVAFEAQIVDAEASRFGVVYTASDYSLSNFADATSIIGAAIFGARGDQGGNTGGGTGPDVTPVSDFSGTRANQVFYTYYQGSLAVGFGGSATLDQGNLTAFESILANVDSGSTNIVEAGDLGDIAWARWTNGTLETTGLLGDSTTAVGANGGYHVMSGAATFTLPASGRVDYTLAASTSATDNQGSAPGTITGDMAIQFGTVSTVGYELQMSVGGRGWGVATPGGASDPGQGLTITIGSAGWTFGGTFSSASGTVTGSGGACSLNCFVTVAGALYGDEGEYVGIAMNVTDPTQSATVQASGLAIFTADTAYNPYLFSLRDAAPMAAAPEWDRWNVSEQTSPGTLPGGAIMVAPADIRASRIEAEALLGGLVTFTHPQ